MHTHCISQSRFLQLIFVLNSIEYVFIRTHASVVCKLLIHIIQPSGIAQLVVRLTEESVIPSLITGMATYFCEN